MARSGKVKSVGFKIGSTIKFSERPIDFEQDFVFWELMAMSISRQALFKAELC